MEPPKKQKPFPLNYAKPSTPHWVEWSAGKQIMLGCTFTALWWVLYFGLDGIANLAPGNRMLSIPIIAVLFPFAWINMLTYPKTSVSTLLPLFANSIFWGFGIALILHRWRRR